MLEPRDSGNPTLSVCGEKDVTVHVECSTIVHCPNLGVTYEKCELKQKEKQEERNAGYMTEFLVNRPVVVLVENHKLQSARTFGQRNC